MTIDEARIDVDKFMQSVNPRGAIPGLKEKCLDWTWRLMFGVYMEEYHENRRAQQARHID